MLSNYWITYGVMHAHAQSIKAPSIWVSTILSTTNYLEYSVKLLSCYHPPTVLLRHFASSDGKVRE